MDVLASPHPDADWRVPQGDDNRIAREKIPRARAMLTLPYGWWTQFTVVKLVECIPTLTVNWIPGGAWVGCRHW